MAGTLFGLLNYLSLSDMNNNKETPFDELSERFAFRKDHVTKVLAFGKELGEFQASETGWRVNPEHSPAVSSALQTLFQTLRRPSDADSGSFNQASETVNILKKCRESLYRQVAVSS